jgi:DNA-binding CsgD family transcriptional regulator
VKEEKLKFAYSHEAAKTFYFVALCAFTISLLANQPEYFRNERWELITLDAFSFVIIYLSLFLYLKKYIGFKLNSAAFIYFTVINLSVSIWYHYHHDLYFTGNFLFNTFIYSIYLVLAGFCIGRNHVYFVAGFYIATYVPLIFISKDIFLLKNAFIIPFLIILYSIAVSSFLYILNRSHHKELELKESIMEKDKALINEKNKWLNCQLEASQREILANSMFLIEHVENNNTLIHKLNVLKRKLKPDDEALLNTIIQEHKAEHFRKYWEEFETSFLKVNPEFYNRIHHICPALSPSERKLAALIHLGLSSKQIGRIGSISPESVDVARSRLRNKLNLPADSNLRTFLLEM